MINTEPLKRQRASTGWRFHPHRDRIRLADSDRHQYTICIFDSLKVISLRARIERGSLCYHSIQKGCRKELQFLNLIHIIEPSIYERPFQTSFKWRY